MRQARPFRVFGIGLSKTGTQSLAKALTLLGLRCKHYPDPALMLRGRYDEALDGFAAAADLPVSAFFRELDSAYPESKFILTIRPEAAWLPSIRAHTEHILRNSPHELEPGNPKGEVRRLCLGTPGWDRDSILASYRRHEHEVRRHFEVRPDDLLVIDVTSGDPWDPLCAFLGRPRPSQRFPHLNRRSSAIDFDPK